MGEKLLEKLKIIDSKRIESINEKILSSKLISSSDIDIIESCIHDIKVNDVDSILYNVMYLIALYNAKVQGLQKESVKEVDTSVPAKSIGWSDILTYLDINVSSLEPSVLERMKNVTNFSQIKETARFIKNSRKPENRIINKISDVNIVLKILMYSNKRMITKIISYFKIDEVVDGRCLGKAIEAIPSIFMENTPDDTAENYNLFIDNYDLLVKNNVNARTIIINKPVIMISTYLNDLVTNIKNLKLDVKTMLEMCGNILILNPGLLEKNVMLLRNFGIDLDTCKIGLGYEVFGYKDLEDRLATIKNMSYDDEVLNNSENSLEVIRAFFIAQNYNRTKEIQLKRCA